MRAVQYRTVGAEPEVVEIPTPEPGPGQVRLKVTAAGLCHSDQFVMSLPEGSFPLPLTLGHEGAGVVDALGDGATGVSVGDSVLVYGAWGCGLCHACAQGAENYCPRAGALGIAPPGLGAPGALAEYLIVDDVRHLVPLGDLDPVASVSLTDAGLTPYHAIVSSLGALPAGSTAVVIGVGGLGHVAVQILRAITGATVIALDISDDKLKLAREVGAHRALHSDEHAVESIRSITGGVGASAVFDMVGSAATLQIARQTVAMNGVIQIVGIGGAVLPTGFFSTPYGATVRAPYWGTRSELIEVLDLARSGAIHVETERYTLEQAPEAYRKMHEGTIRGRAVVVP